MNQPGGSRNSKGERNISVSQNDVIFQKTKPDGYFFGIELMAFHIIAKKV